MNTTEMMNALDGRAKQATLDAVNTANKYIAEMRANGQRVQAQLQKIRDIRPVVKRLFEERLVKYNGFANSQNDFVSDGISHGIGFMRCKGYGVANFDLFGIEGGGVWYDSVCVNIDSGYWGHDSAGGYDFKAFMPLEDFIEHCGHIRYDGWCRRIAEPNYMGAEIRGKVLGIANNIDKYVDMVENYVRRITSRNLA